MSDIFVPISFFLMIFGIFFIYLKTRNNERLALIEKGYDAELFNQNKKERLTYWTLRIGFLILGFGIGFMVGLLINSIFEDTGAKIVFASIFIFSGLSWIIEFALERKLINKDKHSVK